MMGAKGIRLGFSFRAFDFPKRRGFESPASTKNFSFRSARSALPIARMRAMERPRT